MYKPETDEKVLHFFQELTTVEFYVRKIGRNSFSFPLLGKSRRNPVIIGIKLEKFLHGLDMAIIKLVLSS